MASIKTIDDLDARGKRVLVRVDFNVPVSDGVVTDDTRIKAALPTIKKLVGDGARVILMSHLGRPSGEGFEEKFSLRPAALRLAELLGKPVAFASDTVGEDAQTKAAARGCKLLLPVDVVCADKFAEDANTLTCSVDAIPADMMGLDVGPETAKLYADAIADAQTVFWNGPMGVFEMDAFAAGTKAVALAVAANKEADTVIGGGDSVAAVNKFNLADQMTFISTGGGASMELVQGEALPGVEALR